MQPAACVQERSRILCCLRMVFGGGGFYLRRCHRSYLGLSGCFCEKKKQQILYWLFFNPFNQLSKLGAQEFVDRISSKSPPATGVPPTPQILHPFLSPLPFPSQLNSWNGREKKSVFSNRPNGSVRLGARGLAKVKTIHLRQSGHSIAFSYGQHHYQLESQQKTPISISSCSVDFCCCWQRC